VTELSGYALPEKITFALGRIPPPPPPPEEGHDPQSAEQEEQFSLPLQEPSPQVGSGAASPTVTLTLEVLALAVKTRHPPIRKNRQKSESNIFKKSLLIDYIITILSSNFYPFAPILRKKGQAVKTCPYT
jgi:hypothetical protein